MVFRQRSGEYAYVSDRQVQPFHTSRWHDMRRVSRNKQLAVLHRLNHGAPHSGHALLNDASLRQRPALSGSKSDMQFLPDSVVGPLIQILIRLALKIESADLRRPHTEQRETAIVVGVDQFFRRRRRLRQNAQPAKRIYALKRSDSPVRNRRPANSMGTVASRNEIASELLRFAILAK